jgi:hypothetical protein
MVGWNGSQNDQEKLEKARLISDLTQLIFYGGIVRGFLSSIIFLVLFDWA